MVLKEPYGLVLDSLAKPSANMAFMMPKRVADTDPNTQITDYTGSGPFIFKKDEWKPGEKAVFVKNPKYKPRSEPPSGLAGGKVVKVDRVEWVTIPDQQTQVNALLNGEIDMVESVPPDLLPLLQKDKNVKVLVVNKAGRQYDMRFNVLHKPFDNAKVREAVLYALDQKPFLEANVGNPDYYTPCKSVFPCGSPLETTKGWEDKLSGNVAKAKELLKEAGYDGTPVVLLHQTDIAGHNQLATVAKPQLEAAGFKVDLQAMDWQTLVARRAKKEPLDKGGWSAYLHLVGLARRDEPGVGRLHQRLVRQGDVRLDVRRGHREAARCLSPRKPIRPSRRRSPSRSRCACRASSDLRAARPVHHADGDPQQHPGLLSVPELALWNVEKK